MRITCTTHGELIKIEGENGAMKHGRQLGRNRSLDGTILQQEANDQVQEGINLNELGKKFESDKAKLEDKIKEVQNSRYSDVNKNKLITELENGIKKLQEQYDKEVAEKEQNVRKKLESQIESMQEAADEMERQADSLRNVHMDVTATDASAVADIAETQKQAFEDMKNKYVEKLKLQIEQAEIQKRIIRSRDLSRR